MAESGPWMEKLYLVRSSRRLGIHIRFAVAVRAALRTQHHLGVLVGHLVQKRRKRLSTFLAQHVNRVRARTRSGHDFTSRFV
jgi:hypothetical protein